MAAALALDEQARQHWLVTLAFCTQAAGDAELAVVQRDAYRVFRTRVAHLVETCGIALGDAQTVAEHLIATVDGVALQAMFDPASWPADRQLAALDDLIADLGHDGARERRRVD